MPLSRDGEEGHRGLLPYVVDDKTRSGVRAFLKWILRFQARGSEKRAQEQAPKQHKTQAKRLHGESSKSK